MAPRRRILYLERDAKVGREDHKVEDKRTEDSNEE